MEKAYISESVSFTLSQNSSLSPYFSSLLLTTLHDLHVQISRYARFKVLQNVSLISFKYSSYGP